MEMLQSFIISVLASVVAHYLCKRLDGDEYGNQAQTVGFSVKEEEPPEVLQYCQGFVLLCITWMLQSFAYWHYSICRFSLQDAFFYCGQKAF